MRAVLPEHGSVNLDSFLKFHFQKPKHIYRMNPSPGPLITYNVASVYLWCLHLSSFYSAITEGDWALSLAVGN